MPLSKQPGVSNPMRLLLAVTSVASFLACSDNTGPDPHLQSLSGRILFTSNRDGTFHPWSMLPDGTDPVRLTDANMDVSTPAASPDGRTLLMSDGYRILALDLTTRRVRVVTALENVLRMDWSAATGLIVASFFSTATSSRDIALVHPTTGAITPVMATTAEETAADWSPDGSLIAFSSDRDVPEGLQIYVVRPDGSELRRLTTSPDFDGQPDWSPDGSELVFRRLSWRDLTERAGFITLAGNDTTFLPGISNLQGVRFSPDGTQLVVDREGEEARDIWLVGRDGSDALRLTSSAGLNLNPVWVP